MDLRQLTAIVAVADTGTFSAAADRLHTVQSNISSHVARLEKQLGATLFDRVAGRLTEEGQVVVGRARRIQHELEALVADVSALRHEVVGEVRAGVIGTIARWLVPPLLSAMGAAHPGVRLIIVDASTTLLAPQLMAGQLALAVVNLPVNDPDVTSIALFDEDMVAILPVGHALAKRKALRVTDFNGVPLLLPPAGTSYRVELDEAAKAAGVVLSAQAEIEGVRLITSLAMEGVGATLVPATAAPTMAGPGWVRVPLTDMPMRHVGVVHRRRGMLSAPARAVLATLREVLVVEAAKHPGVYMVTDDGDDGDDSGDGHEPPG